MSFDWLQTSGPTVVTTNLNQAQPALVITSNVAVNTDVNLRLRVHDGRFFSDDDVVTVAFPTHGGCRWGWPVRCQGNHRL